MQKKRQREEGEFMQVAVNDVIQIKPSHAWGGCLAIVSEVKSFGCQAYVGIPQQGNAFIRLNKKDYVYIGTAEYVKKDGE